MKLKKRFIKQNQRLINCGHVLNKLIVFESGLFIFYNSAISSKS
jgi:hypothetical protein